MNHETDGRLERIPYIGKIGEYRVLSALLERGVEAYPAIKSNQQDYDITAIIRRDKVVRIQVKTTELNNKSTNNAISGTDKEFDFLVLVVVTGTTEHQNGFSVEFLVLTHEEVAELRGQNALIGISHREGGEYKIRNQLLGHKDRWEKIVGV